MRPEGKIPPEVPEDSGRLSPIPGSSQAELFDPASLDDTAERELLLTEERQAAANYTGERVARNIQRYKAIADALAEGLSCRQIARAFKCHHRTVYAVKIREQPAIDTQKRSIAAVFQEACNATGERILEDIDRIPPQSLAMTGAFCKTIAADLRGDASMVVEHRHHPSLAAVKSGLEAKEIIDVETLPAARVGTGGGNDNKGVATDSDTPATPTPNQPPQPPPAKPVNPKYHPPPTTGRIEPTDYDHTPTPTPTTQTGGGGFANAASAPTDGSNQT